MGTIYNTWRTTTYYSMFVVAKQRAEKIQLSNQMRKPNEATKRGNQMRLATRNQ